MALHRKVQAITERLVAFAIAALLLAPFAFGIQVSDTPSLTVPSSAGPSLGYLAPERKVSLRSVDWCEGRWLPLQRYHVKARPILDLKTGNNIQPEALTLERIVKNLTDYDLSHSSRTQLDRYECEALSKVQQDQLLQKIRAEQRASRPVPMEALQILYCDEHICVTNKPSGVLSVPGPRRNPSLANLIYDTLQPTAIDNVDQMVVHRLDMATSGIIVYALSLQALSKLHRDFKDRRVQKTYQALVEGHLPNGLLEGEIDVDLERDPNNPPFMRIAQPKPELLLEDNDSNSNVQVGNIRTDHKFWKQAPKESLTTWAWLGNEHYGKRKKPAARLELRPQTGRTHQLRVHCAQALGKAIVGDDIYGSSSNDDFDLDGSFSSSLCLHAKRLCICHPISGASMIFEADPPF